MNAQAIRKFDRPRPATEVLGSVPRDVRLTSGGIAVVAVASVMAIAAIAIPIVLSILYVRLEGERVLRTRDTVSVDGRVQQIDVKNGERPRRVVTYRYESGGRAYAGRVTLRKSDPLSVSQGGLIRIAYASSRPDVSWVPGYEPAPMPFVVIPLTAAALLLVAVACGSVVRRQWVLLSEGRVAQARITSQKRVHSDKHRAWRVSYDYQTISGAAQTSRYDMSKTPPPTGSLMTIVYHREKPQWSAPYPLALVRPALDGSTRRAAWK